MKTPDEIKKGLECCPHSFTSMNQCYRCPYEIACYATKPRDRLMKDALAYIQQLERERDAAVEDIHEATTTGSLCYTCIHNHKGYCIEFDHGVCEATVMCGQYKWRSVKE